MQSPSTTAPRSATWAKALLALAALALLAACSGEGSPDDAAGADGRGSEASVRPDMPTQRDDASTGGCVDVQSELYACASVSEGRSVCISLTLSADGLVARVASDPQAPPSADELTCIRGRLLGKCVQRGSSARRICAQGV
ncbi:MAG: hypothetical protein KC503_08135 [Myxococcales bacterium]|nr:hypothetical protein [Myxococcales bacterium]